MKLWIPSDSDLTFDEKIVLSQRSHRQLVTSRSVLQELMADKLTRLMDQEDDPLEMLRVVPDLYLSAMYNSSNRDRALAIVDDSSLGSLVNRVNLDKPWEQVSRHQEELGAPDSLSSLLGSLALSLRM